MYVASRLIKFEVHQMQGTYVLKSVVESFPVNAGRVSTSCLEAERLANDRRLRY